MGRIATWDDINNNSFGGPSSFYNDFVLQKNKCVTRGDIDRVMHNVKYRRSVSSNQLIEIDNPFGLITCAQTVSTNEGGGYIQDSANIYTEAGYLDYVLVVDESTPDAKIMISRNVSGINYTNSKRCVNIGVFCEANRHGNASCSIIFTNRSWGTSCALTYDIRT